MDQIETGFKQEYGDFSERWQSILDILPANFSISRLANGEAALYCYRHVWAVDGIEKRTLLAIPNIEQAAETLNMLVFCKVLMAYDIPLKVSVPMYRVCVPQGS